MGVPGTAVSQEANIVDITGGERVGIAPSPIFWLVHTPMAIQSWDLVSEGLDGPTWVPGFALLPLVPGANGIKTQESNDPATSFRATHRRYAEQGRLVLPMDLQVTKPEHLPTNVQAGGLVRFVTTRDGGRHYHLAQEGSERGPGNVWVKSTDEGAWNRYRLFLVESSVIAPPNKAVINDAIQRFSARKRLAASDKNLPPDHRAERVEAAEGVVAKMRAAVLPGAEGSEEAMSPKQTRDSIDRTAAALRADAEKRGQSMTHEDARRRVVTAIERKER